jgi:hypothetical protein
MKGMLLKFGLCSVVQLIRKCVSTVNYKFHVNGEFADIVVPRRGLRQGDSISLYLLLICGEGFSALIHNVEDSGQIRGILICPVALAINRLLLTNVNNILKSLRFVLGSR